MDDKIKEVMGLVDSLLLSEQMQDAEAVSQCREAIETKLRELVPVWLPIESAPKDNSRVLAGFKGQFNWVSFVANATAPFGVFESGYAKPTHWMPLPKEPS